MAKRSRLGGRPGQRRPLQRATARIDDRPTRPPVASLTAEEEARAAELEAAIVAEEKAADQARSVRGRPRRGPEVGATIGGGSVPLATRAADEYRYVQRDVRRIALVGGFLIAILAVLDVLVNGLHLFTL